MPISKEQCDIIDDANKLEMVLMILDEMSIYNADVDKAYLSLNSVLHALNDKVKDFII